MIFINKLNNIIVSFYHNIYEWFYITFNKTTYWEYTINDKTVYCSISKGTFYITLEDYRVMEKEEIGQLLLNNLKSENVKIKVVI